MSELPPDTWMHSVSLRIETDHPSLEGHFPGQPVVPGVLILDRVLAALQSAEPDVWRVAGLPRMKFLLPLLPGQDARIEWLRDGGRLRFRVFRQDAMSDGVPQATLLASGELKLDGL